MNYKIKTKEIPDLKIFCLVFTIALTISIVAFISIPTVNGQNGFFKYTDPQGRFSIEYPSDWQVSAIKSRLSSGESIPLLSFISTHGTNFNIVTMPIVANLDPSLPLNNFVMGAQRVIENPTIDQNIECSTYTVSEQKACSIIIEGFKFGIPVKILIVDSVVNGIGYFFTFTDVPNSFNFDLPTFERIISSFQTSPSIGTGTTTSQSPFTTNITPTPNTGNGFRCNDPSDVSCYPSNIPSNTLQQMENAQEEASQGIINNMN